MAAETYGMDSNTVRRTHWSQLAGLLALMRPRHWIKNGFVLTPLLFTGLFANPAAVGAALFAVFLFCVASSASYIVNDIHDIERDRKHPGKSKTRPLAAGTVAVPAAIALTAILYGVLAAGWFAAPGVTTVIVWYVILNIAYTWVLKEQPVLDIFTIAAGFVLRVYAGAVALSVPLSGWMAVTTLCLALYLAAIKRGAELSQNGADGRKVLEKYTVSLTNRYAQMSATGAMVFYSLFVMNARPQLVVTIPLVLFGLFRYWYVVERLEGGQSPTDALLADWHLIATVLLWIGACAWVLWPEK